MSMCMLMCMCMLDRRTQLLLTQAQWNVLTKKSKIQDASVGELIRRAIDEVYVERENVLASRRKAIERIRKIRPKPYKGIIDYEELINYGRKY